MNYNTKVAFKHFRANLIEHRTVLKTVYGLFSCIKKPKYIEGFKTEFLRVGRGMSSRVFVRVSGVVKPPIKLPVKFEQNFTALLFVRNFASREIHKTDIPEEFRTKPNILKVLICSQTSSDLSKFTMKDKILVWELGLVYKLPKRSSKWNRHVKRLFEVDESGIRISYALIDRIRRFFKFLLKPFLEWLNRLFPSSFEQKTREIEKSEADLEDYPLFKFLSLDGG